MKKLFYKIWMRKILKAKTPDHCQRAGQPYYRIIKMYSWKCALVEDCFGQRSRLSK